MPKKHQQRSLQIKPQSTEPHTLSLSKSARPQNEAYSQRSVNDLIRDSRRQRLRSETRSPTAASHAHSLHPSVRAVLDLPPPPSPAQRFGLGSRSSGSSSGPSRLRRIPGPPPPRSWLTDSIHAPLSARSSEKSADGGNHRIQVRTSNLPDGAFPPEQSLQHLVLKKIASDWEWHAEQDLDYFNFLPLRLRETLLSYIAVYGDHVTTNPLKILLLHGTERQERDEVLRLDMSNALGYWTTFRQLERDLLIKSTGHIAGQRTSNLPAPAREPAPESWDAESDSEDFSGAPTISPTPKTIQNFANLRHLSLAIAANNAKAASWSSLLSLATELRTLTSLSLAYWPQPTFTPNAALTRAVIESPGSRPVVYGGSDIYTSYDNNWREAAGILRTLSRSLYCLKWLDFTGCAWIAALQWVPSPSSSPASSPRAGSLTPPAGEFLGPEWNGGWRGLEKLILEVGWRPVAPVAVEDCRLFTPDTMSWNVENERRLYRYKKDREQFSEIRNTAQSVARHLRAVRKLAGGNWLYVEVGEDLEPLVEPKW